MYVGGYFDAAGDVPAKGLACWDGTNWHSVGGFEGIVLALATDGTNLYVWGSFTNAGGRSITNVAKWNGTNRIDLGGVGNFSGYSSYGNTVRALAWREGKLYVGGWFTVAGGVPATNLAVWDGQNWTQIGGGVGDSNGLVAAIEFHEDCIYVAGRFSKAGSVSARNIARWTGTHWEPLGSGLIAPSEYTILGNTPVTALAFCGSDLFAVGAFTNAGGVTAARVAKWNGSTWSALGGLNDLGTRAIAHDGSVYICGLFTMASNVIASRIVRWDGTRWQPVHGMSRHGTHYPVEALAVGPDGLYMGACSLPWDKPRRLLSHDGTVPTGTGSGQASKPPRVPGEESLR